MKEISKKVAIINSMSGYGSQSMLVDISILSSMGIKCAAMPTVILSNHTAFESFTFDDYSDRLSDYMDNWIKIGMKFDGIIVGYIASVYQVQLIINFIQMISHSKTLILVDPIMGDRGNLYRGFEGDKAREIRRMTSVADIITPNITEACYLTNTPYHVQGWKSEELKDISDKLFLTGSKGVVITGIEDGESLLNYVRIRGENARVVKIERIGLDRFGSGDILAALILGLIIRDKIELYEATTRATKFVGEAIKLTIDSGIEKNHGICFEPLLANYLKP